MIWELAGEHGVSCTFAGGVPVTYSRPGQAALAFLAWYANGFEAERLREALASGALTLRAAGEGTDGPSTQAAARAFRHARIGWGRLRHVSALDRLVASLEAPERPSRRDDITPEELADAWRIEARHGASTPREPRGPSLAARWSWRPPRMPEEALRVLAGGAMRPCRNSRGDERSRRRGEPRPRHALPRDRRAPAAPIRMSHAGDRLRDAVQQLAVMADRPRPGRVHVSHFRAGGHSGRARTFLAGLDDPGHPGRDLEDPVLLDDERRRINAALAKPLLAIQRSAPANRRSRFMPASPAFAVR